MNERNRRLAAAVGVAALAGGVAALFRSGGDGTAALRVLLYAAGGVLGVWMAVRLVRDRGGLQSPGIDTLQVESATRFPVPGDELDRTLSQFDGRGRGFLPDRSAIHSRLRDLAVAILARRRDTGEAAREAVEAGEWPDDPLVAAFLRNPDTKLPRSRWDHVREFVGDREGPSDFQELTRRTVDALARRSRVVDVDADSADSTVVLDPDVDPDDATAGRRRERTRATADDVGDRGRPTGRWRTAVPAALAFVGFGLVFRSAAVVLAGAVALGFAVYAKADVAPRPSLVVERAAGTARPDPGAEVKVTTTVRNDGDRPVPDLRVVDGVPDGLAVTDGSPRHGTALRPGESTSFTYTVTARRGVHEFDRPRAVVRGYAGATARVRHPPTAEGAVESLHCVPPLDALPVPVPLYAQTGQYLGRLPAGGGEGVEFHSTREYRPGDTTTRIDWKRLARSPNDDLTTVRFREERAAAVVLVLVADSTAYLARGPDDPGAFERSVEAAGRLFGSLLDAGDRVGVASIGSTPLWVDPDTGVDHRRRVEGVLATDPAFPPTAPGTDDYDPNWVREFHRRFPAEAQVVLLSPLCDRKYRHVIHRFRGYGHPVTVVSPDPTVDGTVGRRLVRVERQSRIESLRESGVRVVDWDPDDDLAVALGRAATRWST